MRNEIAIICAWIISGSRRLKIFKTLETPKIPKFIQQETKLPFSNVSEGLTILKNKKLIECINPQDKVGRMYQLTNLGKKVMEEIKKVS